MLEDDSYRASSQYRYWSYTQSQLDQIRSETNRLAAQKVHAAFQRARHKNNDSKNSNSNDDADAGAETKHENGSNGKNENESNESIDTLTIAEEQQIIRWGCTKITQIASTMDHPPPFAIIATAIQYLRRFYLTNSPMTYHPKQIVVCAFYLALKAEHYYSSLGKFVAQLRDVSEEDVRAPEFLLMQGLRFMFAVRHPMRGLEGGVAEIRARAAEVACLRGRAEAEVKARVDAVGYRARQVLRGAAQMTDVYFLFTPAQIWLAAVWVVDEVLAADYLEAVVARIGGGSDAAEDEKEDERDRFRSRLLGTVKECARILAEYKSPDEDKGTEKELRRIGRKLAKCQDPERLDIVSVAKAKAAEKRDGVDSEREREQKVKKRKMEREKSVKDGEVFGGGLKSIES